MGQFSPDDRWLAYETNESGRPEIMAQSFPHTDGRFPVSTDGGRAPRWSADGKEINFIAPDRNMMAVSIDVKGSTLEAGRPIALFPTDITNQPFKFQYTVSRDGQFLVNNLQMEDTSASPITVILNWKHQQHGRACS